MPPRAPGRSTRVAATIAGNGSDSDDSVLVFVENVTQTNRQSVAVLPSDDDEPLAASSSAAAAAQSSASVAELQSTGSEVVEGSGSKRPKKDRASIVKSSEVEAIKLLITGSGPERFCAVEVEGGGKGELCNTKWKARCVMRDRMQPHMEEFHPREWASALEKVREGREAKARADAARRDHQRSVLENFVQLGRAKPELTETLVELWCQFGLPFTMVQAPAFRTILGPHAALPSVKYLKASIKAVAGDRLGKVHRFFYAPVLAIDVGTVFRRYLVGCLVERGNSFAFLVQADTEMPDGRMTALSIRDSIQNAISHLKEIGVRVLAVVADNAANMQAIQQDVSGPVHSDTEVEESDSDESPYEALPDLARTAEDTRVVEAFNEEMETEPILFVLRCAAHVIQLILDPDFRPHARGATQHTQREPTRGVRRR